MKAYYDAHHDSYMSPDSVHLSYVELSVPEVAAEVAVDEAGLKAYYESVKERFAEAEKRHARHIFIAKGSDEAAAKKKAEEVAKLAIKACRRSRPRPRSGAGPSAAARGRRRW